VVADISIELSIVDLPAYHNLFPEEWNETLKDETQITFSSVLNVCLLAPIAEEIAFRGVFLGGLLRMQCNPWLAILISTIIFSIMHMSPMMFLNVTIAGFIFGWLFWRTKSLVPGIIAHITCNTIASLCGPVIEYFTNPIQEEYAPNVVLDVIVIIIAIPMLFFALQRINKMVPKSINIERIK
jgi:membrane protease YdiL (CAAX protease family)